MIATQAQSQRLVLGGSMLMLVGTLLAIGGAFLVHVVGADKQNAFAEDIFSWAPRGWLLNLGAQIVSLTGVLVLMAGMTVAFLYKRRMTWARAALGAMLFTSLMMIFFGVIPNEFLTLTQSTLGWSSKRQWIKLSEWLDQAGLGWVLMGNDISISAAALKDMLLQGWILTATIGTGVFMSRWQKHSQKLAANGPPPLVSKYGRPMTKVER